MTSYLNQGNPIIVALDKAGKEGALQIIDELGNSVWGYKLGALLLRYGISLLEEIRERFGSVKLFIDLNLTGTPDFIREAISVYAPYHADIGYIVVNAASGPEGIRAAVETLKFPRILVGSVLDSLRISDVNLIYGTYFREQKTLQFGMMSQDERAAGIYCSTGDLDILSQYREMRDSLRIVSGVRPDWDSDHGTHKYILTPLEAMRRGAAKFVIGHTIREAKNRPAAVKRILDEIREADKCQL